jgi:hypothetical protein
MPIYFNGNYILHRVVSVISSDVSLPWCGIQLAVLNVNLFRCRHADAKGKRSILISALDGGEWSTSHPGHASPLGKAPQVLIGLEAGWASELVWTQRLEEKSFAPARDRTHVVHSVVRHCTD